MADSQEAADLVAGFSIWAVPGPVAGFSIWAVPGPVAGFSIWAVPGPVAAQELGDVIKTYATRLSTPAFLPHMTVVSGVKGLQAEEAAAKLSELANELRVLDVEIETDELYFQCVFGLLTLTDELAHAHRRAKEIYAVERNDEFMPHVSFIYGDLTSAARAELAKELRPSLAGRRLKMEKLQLWRTLGPVESWELVAEARLA